MTMNLDFSPQDHRSAWPMEQRKAWQKAAQLLFEVTPGYPLALLALHYCLSVKGISTVIPGMLTQNDVWNNFIAGECHHLNQQEMDKIRQIYNDNDKFFIR